MQDKIKILNEIIKKSNSIVFLGGAGTSTASGIPDFRSQNGIYNQVFKHSPEKILSHNFFVNNPEIFFRFYKTKMNFLNIKPNIIHKKLVALEKKGKLKCIITQNIDGLHSLAGSKNVIEIHGSIYRNYCTVCHKFYDANYVFNSKDIPKCTCEGIIKPDVVLFEEPLNESFEKAIKYIQNCDTLIVAGTSLLVYPAASLINYFKGENLVLLNKDKTPYDKASTLIINDLLQNIFKEIII